MSEEFEEASETEELGEIEPVTGLVAQNRAAMDDILARLREKAAEQVEAALELSRYCRRLNELDGLSYRQIAAELGVAHTSVFRAVEKELPLNVVFAAARRIGKKNRAGF